MGSIILLDLMGGVALLLWGLHMVQSGVMRAFGADLRRVLAKALSNRMLAFAVGLGLTALLQSSTAVGIMVSRFAADGALALVPALAVMLGGNVGTALVVQLLAFDVTTMAPLLFILGVGTFRIAQVPWLKNLGRIAIGLGLILLALHLLLDTLTPAETAPEVRALFAAATDDPALCILIAALLTWAAHSSVATVLLTMSLAFSSFISEQAALALVLGANLGSAFNPLLGGAGHGDPASYRLPAGNLFNRLVGVIAMAPWLGWVAAHLAVWVPSTPQAVALFHLGFNAALALLFLPLLNLLAFVLVRIFPARRVSDDPGRPRYLDEAALDAPSLALADATRETLHMGGLVETMLRHVMAALMTNDKALVEEVALLDNAVDRLEEAIKLYVTRLTRGSLEEREGRRALDIVSFAINLEHIGDIIDKSLKDLAAKKIKRRLRFSDEGAAELRDFHCRIAESFKLGLDVFMTGDVVGAEVLLREKRGLKQMELAAAEQHLNRLREGRPDSLETTSLHLDVLRDLRRIHSHICSVAYPVLNTKQSVPTYPAAVAFQPEPARPVGL